MRILICSPTVPYPSTSGFAIRVYQFLQLLARRHSVSLLAYAAPADEAAIEALRAIGPVHPVRRPAATDRSKRRAQLSAMFSPVSYQRRSQYSAAMQLKLDELSSREPYDVIQVETSQLATFRFDPRSVLAIVEHDIVYELLHRMYETETSVLRRAYNWTEYAKFKRDEIGCWRRAGAVITTSPREQHIVAQLAPGTPVLAAPNGVDVEYFHPAPEPSDAGAIVMTGYMKTRPNIDAAIYFVEEILPHLLAVHPGLVFYLVGGGAPEEVTRLAGKNVVVTGGVPDVRPYVYKSAVFVVPLRMGGGTRLKVLEALSMKKPVVSTSLGCEGIDVRDRDHLLIADEPKAFAQSVLELLENHALASSLASRGYELVHQHYQWRSVVDRVEAFYEGLVRARGAVSAS